MKIIMEYHIISGKVIETRRCMLSSRQAVTVGKKRAPRTAGNSSKRKINANEREAVKRLARIIHCNFVPGDLWLTLKYSDGRLPADIKEADKIIGKFLRNVRAAYRKETGKKLRYILCTSETSTKTGNKARLHHHLIMDRMAYEIICRYWPQEEISYSLIDGRGDHTALAKYIVQNFGGEVGRKRWSCSRGLEKPIYTEPVPVESIEGIKAPAGADIRENVLIIDEDCGTQAAYMRAVLPERPTVRGGIIHYKKQKRKKNCNGADGTERE